MKKDDQDLLIRVGVLIAGYYLVVKPILVFIGLQKSAEEKRQEAEREKKLKAEEEKLQKIQPSTKTDAEWVIIADAIYRDLRATRWTGADNIPDAMYQANRVKNNTDWIKLYNAFGKRYEYWFGVENGPEMDLTQFIQANLYPNEIDQLNAAYANKNIKYRY